MVYTSTAPSPPELVNVTTIVGSPTKLLISWFPPAEPNGVILFFNIFCVTVNSFESGSGDVGSPMEPHFSGSGSGDLSGGKSKNVITEIVPGNSTRKVVSQLIPYTEYECVVSANTSIGEGENSSVAMGWTDEFGKFHTCDVVLIKKFIYSACRPTSRLGSNCN